LTRRLALIPVLVLALAACGGSKEKSVLTQACPAPPPAMKNVPSVPGNFPLVHGVVFTGIKQAGPSLVVSGYVNSALGGARKQLSKAIGGAPGYSVTTEQHDTADDRVGFAGPAHKGQVKLVQTCKARTKVTVTLRPA
jgi:hypothetical protein